MITTNTVKRLAYAIVKVSKINTSLHYYWNTETPDSIVKNGQALQLISKAFGYKTYKAFSIDIENGDVDLSNLLQFNGQSAKYKQWIDTVKKVVKIQSDLVALTLSGLTYFLIENTFNKNSEWYEHDFNTLLQSIQPNPIWTQERTDLMLGAAFVQLKSNQIPDEEEFEGLNLLCKMLYATNYYFFESLFRCAVFNTICIHEYAMKMHIKQKTLHKIVPVVFTKTPKDKIADPHLIYTLNWLIGDFISSTTSIEEGVLGEIATIPYHRSTFYQDSSFKKELWKPSDIIEKKGERHQRLTQFYNQMQFQPLDDDKHAMFDRYMSNHGVAVADYNDLILVMTDPTWINPYIEQMMESKEFAFVFDAKGMYVTNTEGLQANLYMNMLLHVEDVLDDLITEKLPLLAKCLYVDRFGMLAIHSDLVGQPSFTLKKELFSKGVDTMAVNPSELSLLLNVALLSRIISSSGSSHFVAFKWLYLGFLLQMQCYYYGALKSGISTDLFISLAPVLGVPLPKNLQPTKV